VGSGLIVAQGRSRPQSLITHHVFHPARSVAVVTAQGLLNLLDKTCSNLAHLANQTNGNGGSQKISKDHRVRLARFGSDIRGTISGELRRLHNPKSCTTHYPQISISYTTHTNQPANHSAEMNFFDLPLELCVMVYENVLQEENHIFRDGLPGLLGTRLQITQEVYKLCEITATVRPHIASLFPDDLDDIKRRVHKFESQEGNKGVTVHVIERSNQEEESKSTWEIAYSLDSRALEVMKNDMEEFNSAMNDIGTFYGVTNDTEMFYGWI
jgi:hypothetical protein